MNDGKELRAARADLRRAQHLYAELGDQFREAEETLRSVAIQKRAAFDNMQTARRRCAELGADLGDFRFHELWHAAEL